MGIMMPSNYSFSKMKVDGWVSYIANANNFRKYTMSDKMTKDVAYFDYHMSAEEEKKIKEGYKGIRLRKKYEYIYASTNKVLVKNVIYTRRNKLYKCFGRMKKGTIPVILSLP